MHKCNYYEYDAFAQDIFVDETISMLYKLDSIVTVVDSQHILQHLDEEKPEGVENESVEQVAFADVILLNKTDLVEKEEDLANLEKRIKSINSQVSTYFVRGFTLFPCCIQILLEPLLFYARPQKVSCTRAVYV